MSSGILCASNAGSGCICWMKRLKFEYLWFCWTWAVAYPRCPLKSPLKYLHTSSRNLTSLMYFLSSFIIWAPRTYHDFEILFLLCPAAMSFTEYWKLILNELRKDKEKVLKFGSVNCHFTNFSFHLCVVKRRLFSFLFNQTPILSWGQGTCPNATPPIQTDWDWM